MHAVRSVCSTDRAIDHQHAAHTLVVSHKADRHTYPVSVQRFTARIFDAINRPSFGRMSPVGDRTLGPYAMHCNKFSRFNVFSASELCPANQCMSVS